jgi:hypothetical protein
MATEKDLSVFAIEEEHLAGLSYERLASPAHIGEMQDTAAMAVVLLTQSIRMRVALMRMANGKGFKDKKAMRKFAESALEYADSFTREDVIASYKRIAKPEEH